MKCCPLILVLWILSPAVKSQVLHPGAVKGAVKWYSTDTSAAKPGLRSRLNDNSLLSFDKATTTSLNFHPSLLFTGRQPLQVDLGNRDLRSASYFTVYQSQDTANENGIWYITAGDKTTMVLTTDRMADLSVLQYMNYKDVVRDQPKVNIYVQNKEKDTTAAINQVWNIGTKPVTPQVPIVNFTGLVPEIIAYDRALNSRERLQVASYLALKYGITLTEPKATYLNSIGEKVWDGYEYPQWHRNIAGICRDDASGLKQTIASSSNVPGLLTIASKTSLLDNTYLMWGDNGKPLIPGPKVPGQPLLLKRTWLMKTYGNLHPFTTDVVIDTKPVDAALPVQPVYWLVIDRSAEGKFDSPLNDFIRMDNIDGQGKVTFKNIVWDNDGSGKDVWGIIAAQDLLLSTLIKQPLCTNPASGSLQVKIIGGKAPFQFTVQSTNGVNYKRVEDGKSLINFTDLGTGKYFLTVTDAAQRIYTDSFYINNEDAPVPAMLSQEYELPAGRPLVLNAAENMPDGLLWEWKGPGNFQSFNAQVNITQPGLYTLRCTKNGCSTEQDVRVKAVPPNILYDVTVYPNPTPSAFNARITLDKPAPVTMYVYGPDGKLITTQKGDNRSNYLFTGNLKAAGTYEVVLISGLSKTTKRLVIVK